MINISPLVTSSLKSHEEGTWHSTFTVESPVNRKRYIRIIFFTDQNESNICGPNCVKRQFNVPKSSDSTNPQDICKQL